MSAPGVSLWEVVEARGGPLSESETWAVLAAAATSLQDTALSGDAAATGMGVVTPESVVLLRCGRVELSATAPHSPVHPHGNYLPPESFDVDGKQPQSAERSVVFSLGRTLWACAEYGSTCGPDSLDGSLHLMSPALRSALSAMTHHRPAHRLSLVDIFQLLVERLNGQDRLNYTATIRALYAEVLGPPQPPPQPPDPARRRNRSNSALEPKTSSSSRRLTSHSWSSARRATSVEDLSNLNIPHKQAVSHVNPILASNSPSVHILQTPKGRAVIRMGSIQDVSLLNHSSLSSSDRMTDDGIINVSLRRNLLQSKLHFHSIDNLSPAKENIQPRSLEGSRLFRGGGTMNPIQEVSPIKSPPTKSLLETSSCQTLSEDLSHPKISDFRLSPSKDARLAITVGRSATVAGDMKGPGMDAGIGPRVQKRIPPKKPPRARAMSVDNLLNAEVEMRQGKLEEIPKKRRMVTRTPSRLYRFADPSAFVSHGSLNGRGPAIFGPEFVVRSKEPVKMLSLLHGSQTQRSVVKKVTVVLLTGRRVELSCDPSVTRVNHVLQAVLEEESIALAHLLGLAVLGGGEFHFVAPQTKLHKVAPPGWKERHPTKDGLIQDNFTLHLRIMYYLKFSHVDEMDAPSRQLLYLQLRHDLLESRLPLAAELLLQLASLALQAEFGDQRHQDAGYFLPEHYVPEPLLRGRQTAHLTEELQKRHTTLNGLLYTVAQTRFISLIQDSQHYGTHYYHVTQDKGRQQLWLGIGREGVLVLGTGPPSLEAVCRATIHGWPSIKRLSYASHRLTLTLRSQEKAKIKFNLQENRSRHVFYLATVHKSFHRETSATPVDLPPPVGLHLVSAAVAGAQGTAPPGELLHARAPSSASSATTTARTSLSSAGTADEIPGIGGRLGESGASGAQGEGVRGEYAHERAPGPPSWPGGDTSVAPKSSEGLSRANFLSEILWRGGGDESDEVFSLENLENEQQWKQRERQKQQSKQEQTLDDKPAATTPDGNASAEKKASPHRVFHQRSKSNIESGSVGSGGAGGAGGIADGRAELSREFGSDESLLSSPKKGQTVRMGTRVSAAALQKRRLRSLEGLAQLPSLEELNTTPRAIVVEPSIRSTVVEESVSDSLVERFLQCPAARGGPERRLDTVTLLKKDGSLGVMIAEGVDHGLYIQAVSPGGPAALQGTLKPGDRIVGINGRSVETLPYAAAVDLLRQISDSVTLLVSQPVVTSSSSSSAPARASSTHTTQAHTTPIVSPDARASAGPGGEAEARERKEARVQLLGGARSFITEVRSGPVTVITLNATPPPASSPAPSDPAPAVSTFEISVGPRVPAEGAQGGGAGGGPAQAASSKQTAQIRKSRPVPTPRRSLTSSGSSTGPGPDSSSDPESSALPQSWSSLPDLKGAERGTPHTSSRGRVPRPRARRCSDSSRPDRHDGSFSHQARTVARDWPPPVRVTPSAVRRRPSLYRAELVQNDDQDRFSTCSSAESLAATPTRPRLRPATQESCFSTYDLCTTDNSRFFTVGNDDNDNKQYRTFHREFGMDLEGKAARGLDSRGRTAGGHEAWREPGAWEASVHETREGKSKGLATGSESGATKQYIKGACGPIDKQSSILSGHSGDGVSKRTSNIHNILGASSNKKSVSGATNKHSVHRLTNQIYGGTTNKPSDLLYSPRNKESDVACVVHKDDFKQELSDKLSSVNRNICESTYEFGRLGDDGASKGSLGQDSVSSGPLSLVPWQGSSECLLDDPHTGMEKGRKEEGGGRGGEGEGEVSASLSLPDLPKDTMLDRVLRCFDALHIAHSQITLRHENQDGGKGVVLYKDNLESVDSELWKHRFGIEDSRHNLFFRDFSLEEREFPESSAGSVSSAADQERIHVDLLNCSLEVQESSLCRSSEAFNRTSHAEASSTSSSPTPVTEVIITPPEGFRCDPDLSLSDEESSDSLGKPLAEQGENLSVSQTEIAENPENIGTAVPHTQNNVDDTLHSQINERENLKGTEPPTQTQAQEIVFEAAGPSENMVPFRLITEREYQYHLKIKRKESVSEAGESEICKEPPSENIQKQECGKNETLLEGENGSPRRLSNTERPSRVAYLKGLLFGGPENQPDTSASVTKSKDKGSDTKKPLQPKLSFVDAHDLYSSKDNGSNVSKDAHSVFEESHSIHDQLIRSKMCEKIRTSSNSEGIERKSSVSTQASTGTHVESDYSSSSTGTPPPVNFTTHPLSSTSSKENLLDEGNSDSKEVPLTVNEEIVGDSAVCSSPPETQENRFLSTQNESRFPLHKMYPDSDSESDEEEEEEADIKTKANVELSAMSLESEKSEELELFINNPESMIVGKVCISEEDPVFEVEEDANAEATEGGEGDEASELIVFRLHVSEPSAHTPSPSPPLRDGWGVDAGPTVSEELLSLEGEQFVELLPTLVQNELPTVSAQATGDHADDTTPMVKVPYVLISEDVRQSYETTVTRADLDSCERWVVESRSEAPVSRMYAGATDSSPSSLSADGADSDEELEIFHTTESTPSDSPSAGPGVSDRDSATRSWSHEDHCSISEGTPLVASMKTGNDNSMIREKKKTELTVILGDTKINSRELGGYSSKNETPYFVSIRNLDIQNENAEKMENGSEYNKSENVKDPASKYRLSDVEEEYDPAILESTESSKGRSVVGTFNFLGSAKSSSLANTPSEGPESLDDSYASLQDGVTVLGTYNFVGTGVPADAGVLRCAERPEESPELPSLTDSIISLEDGKHLLGVFDFTKPKHDLRTEARANRSEGRSSSVQCEYKDAASEEKTPDPVVQDTGLEEEVDCVQDPEWKGKSNTTEDSVCMQDLGPSPTTAEDARPSQAPPVPNSAVSQQQSPQKFPSVEAVCQSPAQREEAEDGDLTQEDAEAAGEAKDVCVEAAAATDDSQAGERVVEVYGGVTNHAHAPPTTVSGRSGHVDPSHPQLVDPALLTSLDLESDHAAPAHEMLVTDAPHSTRPHDLNHNNHAFGHKSSEDHVSGRAAKYMVTESGDLAGHDNYAFDHDILSGQDNYGYDPGYSSERSPEDEEGPPLYCSSSSPASSSAAVAAQRERSPRELRDRNSLKVAPGEIINTLEVMRLVPFITEGTTFQVTVIKNLRGLGLAVTGGIECDLPYAGLIRIKKLYPQTPAWLCGQLEVGDILLQANDNPLTGLTSHEALEMLRTVGQEVTLEICRPPPGTMGDGEDLPDGGNTLGVVSTSLTTPNTSHNYLSPSPSFSSCGEFEVQLTKVAGSLGFTLRKQDNSILGHTIRSLVKEPAISDGRLRPGDKIISVNNTDMCSLSHEEAIGFLRTCPETVTLRLYRDAMQTPVSPVSPTEPDILAKPKPLRKEARDMLSDLAFRKQSPSNSPSLAGASGSPGTPRRRRLQKTPSPDIKSVVIDRWDSLVRKTEESLPGTPTLEKKTSLNSIRETDHEVSPFGDSQTDDSLSTTIRSRNSSASSSSLTASNSESRPKRPSFLDLSNGRGCPRKTQFTPPHEVDRSFPSPLGGNYPSADSLDSAPQLTSAHSDTPAFSHLQQGYQSVNLGALHPHEDSRLTNTTSDHNISSHDTDGPQQSGLLKWKGIVFTPEEEDTQSLEESLQQEGDREGSPQSHKPKMVTIELNRGWNSRLGFSLQPKGESTVIKAIYADSVAAKDGRLKMGDIVVKVNGIDVVGWETESVIDLLRKTRGKISVTVLQPLS